MVLKGRQGASETEMGERMIERERCFKLTFKIGWITVVQAKV